MSALKNAFLPATILALAMSTPAEASSHWSSPEATVIDKIEHFVHDNATGIGLAALAVAGFAATRKKSPSMDA